MDRFSVPVSVALAAALVFAGCSGSSPAQPEPTTAIVPPAPAPLAESAGVPDFLAAQFTLTLDPATMQAAIEPLRGGSAQPPQNLQYDLDIARFQARRVLEATDISF
ncbi:MAG TPA: hypothetical protein VEI97_16185, partial [bacterium]|nr:hypothetical protein [bacterium]